jgi:ferritin-like metal-binding protein YciE
LGEAATSGKVKQLFEHHANETRQQIENLEKVFTIMGLEAEQEANPTTRGLSKEGDSLLRKSDESLHDSVAVSAALGTEHFEISAYQTLIAAAEAMGARDVAALLEQNCDQERQASEELVNTAKELAEAVAGPRNSSA